MYEKPEKNSAFWPKKDNTKYHIYNSLSSNLCLIYHLHVFFHTNTPSFERFVSLLTFTFYYFRSLVFVFVYFLPSFSYQTLYLTILICSCSSIISIASLLVRHWPALPTIRFLLSGWVLRAWVLTITSHITFSITSLIDCGKQLDYNIQ